MSAPEPTGSDNRAMYWIIAGVLVVLVVVGLIAYDSAQDDQEAQDKAAQLAQRMEQAGLTAPADLDMIVNTLGNDGGAVCENPANALGKAILADQLTNGASFVGRRPVIADRTFVLGEALILETYCPEELDEFRDDVLDEYKFDDTVED